MVSTKILEVGSYIIWLNKEIVFKKKFSPIKNDVKKSIYEDKVCLVEPIFLMSKRSGGIIIFYFLPNSKVKAENSDVHERG